MHQEVALDVGNRVCILAGDFLLSRASVELSLLDNADVTEIVAQARATAHAAIHAAIHTAHTAVHTAPAAAPAAAPAPRPSAQGLEAICEGGMLAYEAAMVPDAPSLTLESYLHHTARGTAQARLRARVCGPSV